MTNSDSPRTHLSSFSSSKHNHSRKKSTRTKLMTIIDDHNVAFKPKYGNGKKPDPAAPKITRPCTECGKKFWSWKALFGHMRCHPERQWRGINPPPNFRRQQPQPQPLMTEDDHEVAACLLLLANANGDMKDNGAVECLSVSSHREQPKAAFLACKKVKFGSHHHHAHSHKNVKKGCFAITRSASDEDGDWEGSSIVEDQMMMMMIHSGASTGNDHPHPHPHPHQDDCSNMVMLLRGGGHNCSICLKRCHWEKGDNEPLAASNQGCAVDLNLPPAPLEQRDCSSPTAYSSSPIALDLNLGL